MRIPSSFWFLVRYGIAGGTGIVLQAAVLYIWVSVLGMTDRYLLGVVLGFALALTTSFFLQKYWTFKDSAQDRVPFQFALYLAVALLGLLMNAALLEAARIWLTARGVDFFAAHYLFAQFGASVVVALMNFGLNAAITFRRASGLNAVQEGNAEHIGEETA